MLNSKKIQRASGPSSGVLALEPPRHSSLSVSILNQGKHLIGSSEVCGIRVQVEGVQGRHAMILVGDSKILLKALDSRTWVNDNVVTETALRPGDRVSIGPITYFIRLATPDEVRESHSSQDEDPAKLQSICVEPRSASNHRDPLRISLVSEAGSPSEMVSEPKCITLHQESSTVESLAVCEPIQASSPNTIPAFSTNAMSAAAAAPNRVEDPTFFDKISTIQATRLSSPFEPNLHELEKQIDALHQQSGRFKSAPETMRVSEEKAQLAKREEELKQLAADLSRQSLRLQDRNTLIAEREADLDRKLKQLAVDNERLATAAQTTRHELAEEYARQITLWQEWDSSYHRTTAELKSQLETVELRRASIQVENERLASDRAEIQRLKIEHDNQRRAIAAERVQATKELGDLQALRAEFETDRRQQLADLQQREALVASDRHILAVAQDELLATRQQMEHDRTLFATERSSESLRREQEVKEHTVVRGRINEEESALRTFRFELESRQRSLEEQHVVLDREREELEAAWSEVDGVRTQLNHAQLEFNLAKQSEIAKQTQIATAEKVAESRTLELQQFQEKLELHQAELESRRRSLEEQHAVLDREREELKAARSEVVDLRTQLNQARIEVSLAMQSGIEKQAHIAAAEKLAESRTLELQQFAEKLALQQAELESRRRSLEEQHAILDREREELKAARSEVDVHRTQLNQARIEHNLAMQSEIEKQTQIAAAEKLAESRTLELHQWQHALELQHAETESRQRLNEEQNASLDQEREELKAARSEVDDLRTQLNHAQIEFNLAKQSEVEKQTQIAAAEKLAESRTLELEQWQQTLELRQAELEFRQRSHEEQIASLNREREELKAARPEVEDLCTQLKQARSELDLTKQSEIENRAQAEAAKKMAEARTLELQQWQQTLELQQAELETREHSHEEQNASLDREREEFKTARSEVDDLRTQLNLARSELDLTQHSEIEKQTQIAAAEKLAESRTLELQEWQQALELQQADLESLRNSLDLEQQALITARSELAASARSIERHSLMEDQVNSEIFQPTPEFGPVSIESLNSVPSSDPLLEWMLPGIREFPKTREFENSLLTDQIEADGLIDETLTGSNSAVANSVDEPARESAADSESFSSISENLNAQLSIDSRLEVQASPTAETRLGSLRAQLAQMFDLPEDATPHDGSLIAMNSAFSSFDRNSSEIEDDNSIESGELDETGAQNELESTTVEPSILDSLTTNDSLEKPELSSHLSVDSLALTDAAHLSGDEESDGKESEDDESPWARRLRELAAVAETANPPSPPAAPINPPDAPSEPKKEECDDEEFSVEAQLARLLGRPLNVRSESFDKPSFTTANQSQNGVAAGSDITVSPSAATGSNHDRSHLTAEPRHKQNKNAVREEVQSFRAVAQMSARKALAKHSWNNLRNDFYLASGLTTASVIATVWYVGSFVRGNESEMWKGITCALATILSGQKLLRSASQLNIWRRTNSASAPVINRPTTSKPDETTTLPTSPLHGAETKSH